MKDRKKRKEIMIAKIRNKAWLTRVSAVYLTAAILFSGIPATVFAAPTADIKINNADGPVTITNGDSWNYSWTSNGATACQLTSPSGVSGITLSGNGGPINPGHPWYPAVGGSTTLTFTCTDGTENDVDTVILNVAGAAGSGGGSGSGTVTADIKANGSDGPVTITNGTSWNYSWTSNGATACQLTSPSGTSGITLAGNGGPIESGHAWYPSVGGSTTLTLTCTNGSANATDTVVVNIASSGGGGGTPAPAVITADIKINGSDGPVSITNGTSWNYSWTSNGATACQLTSPSGTSGITLAGNGGPINPGHPWYPAVGGSTTLTFTCTNGSTNAIDSATIQIVTSGGGGSSISADIKINGSDGPVTIVNGTEWNYSWTSNGATACQLTSPSGVSGITLSGNGGPITSSHPWYPAINGSTTLTLTCTNGTLNAVDSATISVTTPGSSGGGGGRNRSRGSVSAGEVIAPVGDFCPFLTQYMRIGANNDTLQVIKLQAYLAGFEGYNLEINGVFDQATHEAVKAYQLKYSSEILAPWGINEPTGYVYIRTLGKINQVVCGTGIPAVEKYVPAPGKIIDKEVGKVNKEGGRVSKEGGKELGLGSSGSTTLSVPVVGDASPNSPDINKGQNSSREGLAAALFTSPTNLSDLMQCIYEFILILIVLYIIGSVLESVLYKNSDVRKRFFTKWGTISLGLALALVGSYLIGEYCLLLPLLITLVASLGWMFFYPKQDSIKAKATEWQISVSDRTKGLITKTKESMDRDQNLSADKR